MHVNFGQSGFVFIEANVKKWGLAPMTGSLAPPPPYGSEQGSILLEAGREGAREGQGGYASQGHGRSRSGFGRAGPPPTSPGPVRSPTDISLAQLVHIPSNEDVGEGTSRSAAGGATSVAEQGLRIGSQYIHSPTEHHQQDLDNDSSGPPPDYSSPTGSRRSSSDSDDAEGFGYREENERRPMIRSASPRPPIPSYDAAVGNEPETRRQRER